MSALGGPRGAEKLMQTYGLGRAGASPGKARSRSGRVAGVALGLVALSAIATAGSSASTTPAPQAGALRPVPAGTKVHTVSAKDATAGFNSRVRARGGHATLVKRQISLTFHGLGTKDVTATTNGNPKITLVQPAAPTATAGTQMPLVGGGQPILADAPLATGVEHDLAAATCASS